MSLVRSTEGAQFTPAGVLKFPINNSADPSRLLQDLRQVLSKLISEEPDPKLDHMAETTRRRQAAKR